MGDRVQIHGLVVESEVPLLGRPPAPSSPTDLTVVRGVARQIPRSAAEGQVLGRSSRPDGTPFYTVTRLNRAVLLRCHGVCDVEFDPRLTRAVLHEDPSAQPGLDAVVLGGMGIALVLQLRGHLVLHASAVAVRDGVLAFVGRSGMGKSTIATLLCAAGGRLVTDDVLRLDVDTDVVMTHRGSHEARLRPKARSAAPPGAARRRTADDRDAVHLDPVLADQLPLLAVVVPYPDRSADGVSVEQASTADALVVLSAFPRLVGWCDPTSSALQFEQLGELVRRVPLVVATLPWGPPFSPELAPQLLQAMAAVLTPRDADAITSPPAGPSADDA